MSGIFFVAGEKSGDNHGAQLMQALRERDAQLQFAGRGGPAMRAAAGGNFRDWTEQAAVVGLWEVVKHYAFFRREFAATCREVEMLKPDAVVLIDYPGFNLRLARALRKRMPALKIIYYISPQVWAWNQRRVGSMARCIDLMLCIFPFEPKFYARAGLRALFVGHPMASLIPSEAEECRGVSCELTQPDPSTKLRSAQDDGIRQREGELVGIFPGSRAREVKKILPVMLEAARELSRNRPSLHFEIAAASETLARMIKSMLAGNEAQIPVQVGNAYPLMSRANAGMIASGTATLEAALARLPFVLVYRVAWLTYLAARVVVKVKYLGMPNVLAGREIVPEFIQHNAQPRAIAKALRQLVEDKSRRTEMLSAFDEISRKLGQGAAATNAAEAILEELKSSGAPGR